MTKQVAADDVEAENRVACGVYDPMDAYCDAARRRRFRTIRRIVAPLIPACGRSSAFFPIAHSAPVRPMVVASRSEREQIDEHRSGLV